MLPANANRLVTAGIVVAILSTGCDRSTSGLAPAPFVTNPLVFDDDFSSGTIFQPFLGTQIDAVTVDHQVRRDGTTSLKVAIPGAGGANGLFSGGAFTTSRSRDLSGYVALTFWARASKHAVLNAAGFGNDNTGTSLYEAGRADIALTPTWRKYAIPIPGPDKLTQEKGLFFFAEGHEDDQDYNIWLDDIRFETAAAVAATVGAISNPRPSMLSRSVDAIVGARVVPDRIQTLFDVGGSNQIVTHSPHYFTFLSSNEAVARIVDGEIRVVGGGMASITARLGSIGVAGLLMVNAIGPPTTAAPPPALPAADVLSIFSDAYASVLVDTWSASWDAADVSDIRIGGDNVKAYTNMVFAGVEFTSRTVDATAMTHFHLDVWVRAGSTFRIKLVDFGADGVFGGEADSASELVFTASSNPALIPGTWISFDLPLSSFTSLTSREHLAQLILSGTTRTVFIDNVYFHK